MGKSVWAVCAAIAVTGAVAAWVLTANRPPVLGPTESPPTVTVSDYLAVIESAGRAASGTPSALVRCARDPSTPPSARATIIELMRDYVMPSSVIEIERAAGDPDEAVRLAAAATLDALPREAAARIGARLLADSVPDIRLTAVTRLLAVPDALTGDAAGEVQRRAVAEFVKTQHASPGEPISHFHLGLVARAEAGFRQALALGPSFEPAAIALADVQRTRGEGDLAIETLRGAFEQADHPADVAYALGLALQHSGDIVAARVAFHQAAVVEPPNGRYIAAYALSLADDLDGHRGAREGRARLLEAHTRSPADRAILEALVSLGRTCRDSSAALKWAREIVAEYPDEEDAKRAVIGLEYGGCAGVLPGDDR
jgi:tetratricopeptide (TPR) repeat protein